MPAPRYSDEVRELVLGTLWSLWAELGLSGWERHHRETAVDLEALILATARLGDGDPRLYEEALDWSVVNGRLASAVRLKHLGGAADPAARRAMGSFAATVNANSHLNWPGSTSPGAFARTGRSALPALERPALIQLRLRALWGVSARAEVLRVMLPERGRFMGIGEVAATAAYGKDAVADALDSLHRGGLLDAASRGNHRVFRLGRGPELIALIGPQPSLVEDWAAVLPIAIGFLEAAEVPAMTPMARAAEMQRRFREWQPALARLGLATEALRTGRDFLREYEEFTLRALRVWGAVAQGDA